MNEDSHGILRKQKFRFRALVIGVLLFAGILGFYFAVGEKKHQNRKERLPVELHSGDLDMHDVWMSQVETKNRQMEKQIQYLESLILESKKEEQGRDVENEDLRKDVFRLQSELIATKDRFIRNEKMNNSSNIDSGYDPFSPEITEVTMNRSIGFGLQEIVMDTSSKEKVQHVDKIIPAGTTVKAVLVSSLDASCGIGASINPLPVKLRVLDDGHLPKNVKVILKGGVLIGSAYGDISSERVYIRLERMSQIKPSGEFIESAVTGYVSGEDGKYGVRGIVVDRSEKLVASAAFSGFLSGISQFLQATVNAQNVADATLGLPNDLRWDILKRSGHQGAGNALDQLSEYYIKRAEQLQPVIQIAAGRIVDITLTHGVEVGDLHTKEKIKKIREEARNNEQP